MHFVKKLSPAYSLFLLLVFLGQSLPLSAQCPTGDVVLLTQADVDAFAVNYPTCTTLPGGLQIGPLTNTTSTIQSLAPLANLTTITGFVKIVNNALLQDLTGLQNLTSIGDFVSISSNINLTSLSGWGAVVNFSAPMSIAHNPSLTSLAALSGMTNFTGSMTVQDNAVLPNLTGLNGLVNVNLLHIAQNIGLTSLTGLNNLVSASTLNIGSNPVLQNLLPLSNLTSVSGSMDLENNDALTDLSGLQNLTALGYLDIDQNDNLLTLNGLQNIPATLGGVSIIENTALNSLAALANMTSCNQLSINLNPALTNLNGLHNLTSVSGLVFIYQNNTLGNVSAFANLTHAERLNINGNPALTSLAGLDHPMTITTQLDIVNNSQLSGCAAAAICDFLQTTPANAFIGNNAAGCNSKPEVLALCPPPPPPTAWFWGTTYNGGANNLGTLFRMSPDGTVFEVKHNFESSTGGNPWSGLVEVAGKYYGTTQDGKLYEYNPQTNVYSVISTLPGTTYDAPILANGKLYGMTGSGGANGCGVLYEYAPTTNTYTTKYDFNGGCLGYGGLTADGNNLYGTLNSGGANGGGVLFRFNLSTGVYTVLHNFSVPTGYKPVSAPIKIGNLLYGVTSYGGANGSATTGGTIYSYNLVSNAHIVRKSLSSSAASDGYNPYHGMVLFNGKLYGMTYSGGINDGGVLYEYSPGTPNYVVRHRFVVPSGGYAPHGKLTESCGQFYGMTRYGGTAGNGTVFTFNPVSYQHSVLKNLDGATGAQPYIGPLLVENPSAGTVTYYADTDGDGFGNPSGPTTVACSVPAGFSAVNTDCNDANATVYPGATELCDGLDNDCDGPTDEDGISAGINILASPSCAGNSNGALKAVTTPANAAATGTFAWSNGANTQTVSGLVAGTYVVTVTAPNGCSATATRILQDPSPLSIAHSVTNPCPGQSNGSAVALASGGTGAKTYAWSNGSAGNIPTGLAEGTYTVTATDQNGCTATASVALIPVRFSYSWVLSAGKYTVTLVGTGGNTHTGNTPYRYRRCVNGTCTNWGTTRVFGNLQPGALVTFEIRDRTNCIQSEVVRIGRHYVSEAGSGTKSGSSWSNAMDEAIFRTKLPAAVSGDAFWMKTGGYSPADVPTPSASFAVPPGVQIYGGFAGTETETNQRVASNRSFFYGLNASYHVFRMLNPTTGTRLDGLQIEQGNATGPSDDGMGGGLWVIADQAGNLGFTLENCVFEGNSANTHGGGAAVKVANGATVTPVVSNTKFSFNTVNINDPENGGCGLAMWAYNGAVCKPSLLNSVFVNNLYLNSAGGSNMKGGGVLMRTTYDGSFTDVNIDRCRFTGHHVSSGSAVAATLGTLSDFTGACTDSYFGENWSYTGFAVSGAFTVIATGTDNNSTLTMTRDTFFDNRGGRAASVVVAALTGSTFVNLRNTLTDCVFTQNLTNSNGGTCLYIKGKGSAATSKTTVSNCTFSGNTFTSVGVGLVARIDAANPITFANCNFLDNLGPNEASGMVWTNQTNCTFDSCTFAGNIGGTTCLSRSDVGNFTTQFLDCTFRGNDPLTINNNSNAPRAVIHSADNGLVNLIVKNSLFAGNNGIAINFAKGALVNNTISGNFSGIRKAGAFVSTLRNSIVWDNTSEITIAGGSLTVNNCIVKSGFGGSSTADPLFVAGISPATAPNAGGDFHLQAGSPAINTGNNTYAVGLATDLDGANRFIGAAVDMGCYESALGAAQGSAAERGEGNDALQNLNLSPNPFRSEIRLTLDPTAAQNLLLSVFDTHGRLLTTQIWPAGTEQVSVSTLDWPAGVFQVRVSAAEGTWVKTFRAVKVTE